MLTYLSYNTTNVESVGGVGGVGGDQILSALNPHFMELLRGKAGVF